MVDASGSVPFSVVLLLVLAAAGVGLLAAPSAEAGCTVAGPGADCRRGSCAVVVRGECNGIYSGQAGGTCKVVIEGSCNGHTGGTGGSCAVVVDGSCSGTDSGTGGSCAVVGPYASCGASNGGTGGSCAGVIGGPLVRPFNSLYVAPGSPSCNGWDGGSGGSCAIVVGHASCSASGAGSRGGSCGVVAGATIVVLEPFFSWSGGCDAADGETGGSCAVAVVLWCQPGDGPTGPWAPLP